MRAKLFFNYLSGLAAGKILTIICVTLFSGAVCFGQGETESAARLNLTGTSLPAGAQRVLPQYVPADIGETFDKLFASGSGKVQRGDTEVLIWTGGELRKTGAATIVKRLTETLTAAGWKYEVSATENGITFFSLIKSGTPPRGMLGFYGEADGTLLFAMSEMLASGGGAQTNSINTNQTDYVESGNAGDFTFTTPAGWTRADSGGKIVLKRGDQSKIEFLPLMNSSGNLEQDAQKIVWQVFKGYDAWYSNGFEADYGTFEKGKTIQGLEYFRLHRYAKKVSEDNDGFAPSKFDAVILLVKLGSKVAVIAGSQPFQIGDYSQESAIYALDLMLYDLKYSGATEAYNLKNDLLGSWATASGSVALAYTFNANGSFNKGAAIEFRTRRDARTDNVTTTSYGMTQTYSLAGNILTQTYKNTGEIVKYKIRIYHTKYDKDAWQHKIGFLPLENPAGGTIVMRRSD